MNTLLSIIFILLTVTLGSYLTFKLIDMIFDKGE